MFATPNRKKVNTNSKGLILEPMTCSATRFSVPMVTDGVLAVPLEKSVSRCGYAHVFLCAPHTALFRAPFLFSFPPRTPASTHKRRTSTRTQPKEQTQLGFNSVVLSLAHVKISAQSPLLPLMYFYTQH